MLEIKGTGGNELRSKLDFYKQHLYGSILPFWLEKGMDKEQGGYFTCFSNTGDRLVSTDKYVWSQGRMVWLLAKLAEIEQEPSDYLELARMGYEFLKAYCFLPSGNCAFLLSSDGKFKEPVEGKGYDISTYADCFVVLGFAKYAAVSGDAEALDLALRLYDSIMARFERREFRTEPEPLPPGYRAHGISMILLNTSHELLRALRKFNHSAVARITTRCHCLVEDLTQNFISSDGTIRELRHDTKDEDPCILGRYANPGHSLEDMWFIIHYAVDSGGDKRQELIELACRVIEKAFALGWDEEYGGLLHFVDVGGGKPRGELGVFAEHPLTQKLHSGWADKLWWVHSEAVYVTLLAYALTGKDSLWDLHRQIHDYTYATFPHPDPTIGEWIQIRDRQGQPVDKVVALPVKDPFHISRNLILLVELLEEMLRASQGDE